MAEELSEQLEAAPEVEAAEEVEMLSPLQTPVPAPVEGVVKEAATEAEERNGGVAREIWLLLTWKFDSTAYSKEYSQLFQAKILVRTVSLPNIHSLCTMYKYDFVGKQNLGMPHRTFEDSVSEKNSG